MWLFPYLTWATAAMITFVLVYMVVDDANRQVALLSIAVAAVVVAIAVTREKFFPRPAAAPVTAARDEEVETVSGV
jgi:GABA permease